MLTDCSGIILPSCQVGLLLPSPARAELQKACRDGEAKPGRVGAGQPVGRVEVPQIWWNKCWSQQRFFSPFLTLAGIEWEGERTSLPDRQTTTSALVGIWKRSNRKSRGFYKHQLIFIARRGFASWAPVKRFFALRTNISENLFRFCGWQRWWPLRSVVRECLRNLTPKPENNLFFPQLLPIVKQRRLQIQKMVTEKDSKVTSVWNVTQVLDTVGAKKTTHRSVSAQTHT